MDFWVKALRQVIKQRGLFVRMQGRWQPLKRVSTMNHMLAGKTAEGHWCPINRQQLRDGRGRSVA